MGKTVLSVVTESEVELIHRRTLDVFEKIGIKISHNETLQKLKKAGADVNESSGLAKIPAKLVSELLSLAPSVVAQTSLNGQITKVGDETRSYGSLILDPYIVDYERGLRPPNLEDVRRNTIVGDSLDRIGSMMRMQQPVTDVPEPDCYLKTMEVFLTHTSKHVDAYPTSTQNCREWMDIMEVIADAAGLDAEKSPLLGIAMAVTSPLQLHGPNVEMMKMAMERCYPVIPTVCPMAGTTSPYSIAGTFLVSNVETLIPVIMTQLYKPGHPAFYSVGPSVTDLKSGHDLYYKCEKFFFKSMGCQMGKFYNLPIRGEAGGTLTWRPDMQNGAESLLYLLASHLTGQHFVGGLGSLHNALGMSTEQIIMQCGLVDITEYIAKGVDASDYKLAYDSLERIGPGGNYLADDLTLDLMRSDEMFESQFMDLTGGYIENAPSMLDIAHQKADDLVKNYRPTIPAKVQTAIKEFFRKRYKDPRISDYLS
jgi:trimethylamine--corrinoid protein Co-methyltransferase